MSRSFIIILSLILGAPVAADTALSLSVSSRTQVYAFGESAEGIAQARNLSQSVCGETAIGCKVTGVVVGRCMSFVADTQSSGWGFGRGDTALIAERNAMKSCEKYDNKACAVVETRCATIKKEG